ncbi:hypothetical protein GCM10023213_42860 [Prosthecobacter algae]|uniref:Uncharacterized protein n=1 Tax=Prosthecobacter algae TaxID=1144682 RepID=A0ABP9PLK0_9BACT
MVGEFTRGTAMEDGGLATALPVALTLGNDWPIAGMAAEANSSRKMKERRGGAAVMLSSKGRVTSLTDNPWLRQS